MSDEPFSLAILEDPTRVVNNPREAINALYGPLTPSELIPVPQECRWPVACHVKEECRLRMHNKRLEYMLMRVHLLDSILQTQKSSRESPEEFIATHHSSKLDVVRAYPECPSFIVHAFGVDQNIDPSQVDKATSIGFKEYITSMEPMDLPLTVGRVLSSMVIEMPLAAANCEVIRPPAWTEDEMWGLFQTIAVIDVPINGANLSVPAQILALQKAAKEAFLPYTFDKKSAGKGGFFVSPVVFAHRLPNLNTAEMNMTTWRLIVRVDIHPSVFNRIWYRFHNSFLHRDAVFAPFLTWTQVFANGVLPTTSINEQALRKDPYYLQGGATEEKMKMARSWVLQDRDQTWSELNHVMDGLMTRLSKTLAPSGVVPLKKVMEFRVNSQSVEQEAQFLYRVNAQDVSNRRGDPYYYTLPMAANDLQCWQYDPTSTPQPGMRIPIMYVNPAAHNKFMTDAHMTRVPLDSLTMIYHVTNDLVSAYNNSHKPTPHPPPPAAPSRSPSASPPNKDGAGMPHPANIQPLQFLAPQTVGDTRIINNNNSNSNNSPTGSSLRRGL